MMIVAREHYGATIYLKKFFQNVGFVPRLAPTFSLLYACSGRFIILTNHKIYHHGLFYRIRAGSSRNVILCYSSAFGEGKEALSHAPLFKLHLLVKARVAEWLK